MEANYDFGHRQVSYGRWEIECEVTFYNTVEFFKYTTTDSEFIDKVVALRAEGANAQKAYSDFVLPYIGEQIEEWCFLTKLRRVLQWASGEYLTEEIPMDVLEGGEESVVEFIEGHLADVYEGSGYQDILDRIDNLAFSGMKFFRNYFKVN